MNCPTCGHEDSAVIRTEADAGTVTRRRQCSSCGYRWSTVEVPAAAWKQRTQLLEQAGDFARAVVEAQILVTDSVTGRTAAVPVPGTLDLGRG
jgi:transcriptional regulator NrdR family protein